MDESKAPPKNEAQNSSTSVPPAHSNKNSLVIVLSTFIVVSSLGALAFVLLQKNMQVDPPRPINDQRQRNEDQSMGRPPNENKAMAQSFQKLSEPKLLFTGGYADPTILKKSDGSYIMYLNNFSKQPATYEAHTSQDGLTWKLASAKLPRASTGRAVPFGSKIRLYYPDQTPIRPSDPPASILSATSPDGFTFTMEPGTRIDPRDGYYLEGPTVFQLPDKSYRMYVSENETASAEKRISAIWGASSADGVTWTRDDTPTIEATVADEHIPSDWPQALHPFVLTRADGSYLMFYNTHSEVFAATSADGLTWKKMGTTGIHGADVDGYYVTDDTIRLYYGDFSQSTSGVVYTIDIKELQ